jgi:hypothetical protein
MLPRIRIHFFLNNQPDSLIIPIFFCYKTPHVSGTFSAHHKEFSTAHSALVSIMQVSDNRFQAESGWNSSFLRIEILILGSGGSVAAFIVFWHCEFLPFILMDISIHP